ncbi:hypothetical protein ABZ726_03025 [Streptomyces hundungensis]|uniref:hypothetical protein n=1 Tax=Streptomyces hundungensis TaxID=1077946 RepID=UPI0033D92BF1
MTPLLLLREDRPEFEWLLDEVLGVSHARPELAGAGPRLNPEQLRTLAIAAEPRITASAAVEYAHYVDARARARGEVRAMMPPSPAPTPMPRAAAAARTASGTGCGAVVGVVAPVLFGAAAVLFLLVGYILKLVDSGSTVATTVVTTGRLWGALAAATIVLDVLALLYSALRDGNRKTRAARRQDQGGGESEGDAPVQPPDVAAAREAWRRAVTERGILPFLREALADGEVAPAGDPPQRRPHRIPALGYERPAFTSPGPDQSGRAGPEGTRPEGTPSDRDGPEQRSE